MLASVLVCMLLWTKHSVFCLLFTQHAVGDLGENWGSLLWEGWELGRKCGTKGVFIGC